MNAIKYFIGFVAATSLHVFADPATAKDFWRADGRVFIGDKNVRTDLTGVSVGTRVSDGYVIGGFKILEDGQNLPSIAWVSDNGNKIRYWQQTESVQQFFHYQHADYVLLADGRTARYAESEWQSEALQLKPGSIVIGVSASAALVACNPAPLMKSDSSRGSCYVAGGRWSRDINWRSIKPKLCGEQLHAIEFREGGWHRISIDTDDGHLISDMVVGKSATVDCEAL